MSVLEPASLALVIIVKISDTVNCYYTEESIQRMANKLGKQNRQQNIMDFLF